MEILFRAVLPQVLPEFLSYTLFRFEINMRAASTLGLVGAGGIGASLIFAIRGRFWERVAIIVIALIVTVTVIDIISSSIRKKLI
jgi:phosphonate transport system permease protein